MHQNTKTKHRKLTKCSCHRVSKQHRSVDLRSTTRHIMRVARALAREIKNAK